VRFATLLMILILLVVYSGLDWWSGRRLDRQTADFAARYGPLSDRGASRHVPASDNRARLVRAAAALVNAPSASLNGAVRTLASTNSTRAITGELRAVVDANHDAIRLLDELDSRRQSDWEADARLLEVRDLGNVVYASAVIDLADARADAAAARAVESLDIANSLRNEPDLISQLVRIAVGFQPLDVTQRLLTEAEPSRPFLEKLAGRFAESRQTDPIRAGLLGEAAITARALARAEGRHISGSAGSDQGAWAGPLGRLGRPFIRMTRASYLAQMERILEVQSGPRPRPTAPVLPRPGWWALTDRLAASSMSGFERSIEIGDDFSAALAGAEIAVALRRFRVDRGAYPDDLSALVPAYLDVVRIDPFTGALPVYARQGAGFSLRVGRDVHRPLADWIVTK
jgi:hypothetical protein